MLQTLDKLPFLLRLLPRHPAEVLNQVMTVFVKQRDGLHLQSPPCSYYAMERNDSLDALEGTLAVEMSKIMEECSLRITEQRLLNQIKMVRRRGCFSLEHYGDFNLGRCCYLVCRALRPTVVLQLRRSTTRGL